MYVNRLIIFDSVCIFEKCLKYRFIIIGEESVIVINDFRIFFNVFNYF